MNYKLPLLRLQQYITYLDKNIYSSPVCISSLHDLLHLPIQLVRNDFAEILAWSVKMSEITDEILSSDNIRSKNVSPFSEWTNFCVDSDISNDECITLIEYCKNEGINTSNKKEFKNIIKSGRFDHINLYIQKDYSSCFYIPMTYGEHLLFTELSKKEPDLSILSNPYKELFYVKNSYQYDNDDFIRSNEALDFIAQTQNAIENRKLLKISRLSVRNPENLKTEKVIPIKISYNSDNNQYSIIGFTPNKESALKTIFKNDNFTIVSIRLENIKEIKLVKDIHISDEQFEQLTKKIEDLSPNVWGNCFDEPPLEIIVRFSDHYRVWKKVHMAIDDIHTNGILEEKDGYLYYKDTIYGKSSFRLWLNSFGSSAIVIQPKSLQDEIIKDLKAKIERLEH
ncbi:WYL domain-containing protein [Butyrivibrio sp. YAB3001]|uniref:WYL domain-containing protein n=1 Tax=Butyrivibrio sp. YAB3001 TaxID=1520812 RepID=UPI0008F628A9|nr:WYL domain-containing protein [Butyrivibrio sp. YAB3001]SFD02994.1 WYL domain-containing protein [Butyrivibrio sp. YAB3001]